MRLIRTIKDVRTYIDRVETHKDVTKDIITVEHRSNNPKRDYLFVNKKQCKHIPASGLKMINMCWSLADVVNNTLANELEMGVQVLVVGFAETATAIGNIVADNLCCDAYVMQTTRENIPGSKELIRFEEEHSHATTQKLLTYEDTNIDEFLSQFSYILFVEDEISTGNTILNFINEFEKIKPNAKYGVASICNWQNKENKQKFINKNIDIFALITGKLKDTNAVMMSDTEKEILLSDNVKEFTFKRDNKLFIYEPFGQGLLGSNLFEKERLGHKANRKLDNLYEAIRPTLESRKPKSVRIIGTEEFMYIPIKLAESIELKYGIDVICHSTTRSPIDILNDVSFGTSDALKSKNVIPSVYDKKRTTYLYNLDEKVDMIILVTDTEISESLASVYYDLLSQSSKEIIAITL